ncbi:uncharacterized protein PHACADRAFT_85016 [Phanerochaete carnosa HHB-10118-sp]|uniref:RING-CH-type domain-containing protein n=1 Tax=Phanerochaete carnosa (strain HHB-10118-sp) TaxID=650164 RepID=K5WNU8_PHACS|nr:uncharacterized protein PHACADRAFT_85016 [Phanerochaete carnosa HHB-10118-sp]EKM61130.1 hypothetical protein PHACADRAFT_85016 [Phanerochaete carnosa HHB-10118-sp]
MPDEPGTAPLGSNPNVDNRAEDAPQCRICLDGEDPELGRLIRPCLCKGSVSCGYHYRFARTQVMGMASNPSTSKAGACSPLAHVYAVVVGALSCIAFTLLLFLSSFVTTYLISGTGEDSYFYPTPKGPPTLLGKFVKRLLLGLPTVGAGSLLNMLWSLPFPITHWLRVRLRRSGRNSSDIMTLILLTAVVIGAARALWKVYHLTERTVKRLLLRAEDAILEVS